MYSLFLTLHSWLRWAAILAGVLAVFTLLATRGSKTAQTPDRWGLFFLIALDLQLLIGLLLYFFVSPNMSAIRQNFGEAMRTQVTRYWAVEHIGVMLLAVVALHVGRALARKATTPDARRRRLLMGAGLALLAMLFGTPWPGRPYGRPLIRVSAQP